MTAADRNDDFEAFLQQRRSLLSQADEELEPPGAVDDAVLKKAHAAIQGRRPATRAARWAMPVGLAATILLCLSIVLNVALNTKRPTAAPVSAARQVAPAREDSQAAGHGATILREGPAVPRDSASALAAKPAPTPSAAYGAQPAPLSDGSAAGPTRTPLDASVTPSAPNIEPSLAAAAQGNASTQQELRRSPGPLAKHEAHDAAGHPPDPKVWLEQIEALRNEGKTAQAQAEMRRFRAAFPAYPVTPPSPSSATPPR